MNAYIYCADIYCETCGRQMIKDRQSSRYRRDEDTGRFLPINYETRDSDSNEYPCGPFDEGGGEADCPQHCGSGSGCLNPLVIDGEKYGAFLDNPLTTDGVAYVKEAITDNPNNPIPLFWAERYADCL